MAQQKPAAPAAGFTAPPADGGLSLDRLAQAFASMMGAGDPYTTGTPASPSGVAQVDASPDLDEPLTADGGDTTCRVTPASILEAMLFVGLPEGKPLTSRSVAGLMRGVRPQEIDEMALELNRRYTANNCPYEVVSQEAGWTLRLRPGFAQFGQILETRARLVRLDSEALDVLAAVAWNQPVARDRLVELGCDASPSVLRLLVRRGLLELHPQPEGQATYQTTPKFLQLFQLESLADLPPADAPPG